MFNPQLIISQRSISAYQQSTKMSVECIEEGRRCYSWVISLNKFENLCSLPQILDRRRLREARQQSYDICAYKCGQQRSVCSIPLLREDIHADLIQNKQMPHRVN